MPTFFKFPERAGIIQDHAGHFIRRAALGVLEEVRVDLKGDRRIGVTEAMLDFGDGRAPAIMAEAQL